MYFIVLVISVKLLHLQAKISGWELIDLEMWHYTVVIVVEVWYHIVVIVVEVWYHTVVIVVEVWYHTVVIVVEVWYHIVACIRGGRFYGETQISRGDA